MSRLSTDIGNRVPFSTTASAKRTGTRLPRGWPLRSAAATRIVRTCGCFLSQFFIISPDAGAGPKPPRLADGATGRAGPCPWAIVVWSYPGMPDVHLPKWPKVGDSGDRIIWSNIGYYRISCGRKRILLRADCGRWRLRRRFTAPKRAMTARVSRMK